MRWFHYIFDPTDDRRRVDVAAAFWVTQPFFERDCERRAARQRIEELLDSSRAGSTMSCEARCDAWKRRPVQART